MLLYFIATKYTLDDTRMCTDFNVFLLYLTACVRIEMIRGIGNNTLQFTDNCQQSHFISDSYYIEQRLWIGVIIQ